MNYITWRRKALVSDILGMIAWMSLSTFMIVVKNAIGLQNIPIFEVAIFVTGLVGVKIAHSHIVCLSKGILLSIVTESIFLIGLYWALMYSDITQAGVIVYSIIIVKAITRQIDSENMRGYEDRSLKLASGKKALQLVRKMYQTTSIYAGTAGTLIALICLTYFKLDLIMFTKIMLLGNIASNIYDWYIWNKYVRNLK